MVLVMVMVMVTYNFPSIPGITPARRAQLLYDLIDGVDLLLVIGR